MAAAFEIVDEEDLSDVEIEKPIVPQKQKKEELSHTDDKDDIAEKNDEVDNHSRAKRHKREHQVGGGAARLFAASGVIGNRSRDKHSKSVAVPDALVPSAAFTAPPIKPQLPTENGEIVLSESLRLREAFETLIIFRHNQFHARIKDFVFKELLAQTAGQEALVFRLSLDPSSMAEKIKAASTFVQIRACYESVGPIGKLQSKLHGMRLNVGGVFMEIEVQPRELNGKQYFKTQAESSSYLTSVVIRDLPCKWFDVHENIDNRPSVIRTSGREGRSSAVLLDIFEKFGELTNLEAAFSESDSELGAKAALNFNLFLEYASESSVESLFEIFYGKLLTHKKSTLKVAYEIALDSSQYFSVESIRKRRELKHAVVQKEVRRKAEEEKKRKEEARIQQERQRIEEEKRAAELKRIQEEEEEEKERLRIKMLKKQLKEEQKRKQQEEKERLEKEQADIEAKKAEETKRKRQEMWKKFNEEDDRHRQKEEEAAQAEEQRRRVETQQREEEEEREKAREHNARVEQELRAQDERLKRLEAQRRRLQEQLQEEEEKEKQSKLSVKRRRSRSREEEEEGGDRRRAKMADRDAKARNTKDRYEHDTSARISSSAGEAKRDTRMPARRFDGEGMKTETREEEQEDMESVESGSDSLSNHYYRNRSVHMWGDYASEKAAHLQPKTKSVLSSCLVPGSNHVRIRSAPDSEVELRAAALANLLRSSRSSKVGSRADSSNDK
eukprot:GILK01009667.1.p1 GENE.GILK01009667.1~~GILK01009667.1.p1  ORF type:complete len:728 (-),score=197.74 GILK01009667.1:22-2205(-)